MPHLQIVYLFIALLICPLAQAAFEGVTSQATALEHPISFAVPPKDMQTGGADIFSQLTPVSKSIPIYINQQLDLSLLGPGSNIIVVSDTSGKYIGFAFSNGRFDAEHDQGQISTGEYPNRVPRQEGKYPWPRDARGRWLRGDKLLSSNGPHHQIKMELIKFAKIQGLGHEPVFPFVAGHVGVNAEGKVYLGYVSAAVNSDLHGLSELNKSIAKADRRALPAYYRSALHQAIQKIFTGLNLNKVLQSAPSTEEDILQKNAISHYPPGQLIPPQEYYQHQNPLGLLNTLLGDNNLDNYVKNAKKILKL